MRNYVKYFDKARSRHNTNSYKYTDLLDDDVIPMTVADMDLPSSSKISKAIIKRAKHNMYGYTLRGANDKYYESVINWYKDRFGINLEKDYIVYSPGVITLISFIIDTFSKEMDKIIIQEPVYDMFKKQIKSNKRIPLSNRLILEKDKYIIDFKDLEEKAKDAKIMIFCSPHNPLGIVWNKFDMLKVYEICEKNNVLLISDEIHSDLVYSDGLFKSMLSLDKSFDNLIVATSIGKTFNTSGLHMAHAFIVNKKIRTKLKKRLYSNFALFMSSPLGNEAVIAAYTKGGEYVDNLVKYLERNRDYIKKFVSDNLPSVKFNNPQATYLGWLDFSYLGLSDDDLDKFLESHAKVKLNIGKRYGEERLGYARINFAVPFKRLKEVLDRIKKAVDNFKEEI